MQKGYLASLSLCALLLAGCASTPEECDPSQDQGFFGKIGCVVSGSYDERVEQRVVDAHVAEDVVRRDAGLAAV